MRPRLVALVVAALAALWAVPAIPSSAEPVWAPAESAAIGPGVQTYTDLGDDTSAQCTANFVFTDGDTVYLGQAAHCGGGGLANEVNGCDQSEPPRPIGTRVEIEGFDGQRYAGTLAYSSWNAMSDAGEKDDDTCFNNDFALVELPASVVSKVNPSVPFWGGPTGTRSGGTDVGDDVLTYGNSSLRFGIEVLRPKSGVSLGTGDGGWRHTVATATPGVPGDSGSAVLDGAGQALGVLVTVALVPPATNGVSDLTRLVGYARAHGVPGLTLVTGTEALDRHEVAGVPVPL